MPSPAHIVITDSGLGGLSICAALEMGLRRAAVPGGVRLTYVNAWPFEDGGYNDLPDTGARATVFDAALARMAAMRPDRILIACNTLSILYPHTTFSRRPPVPVHGIVDAGVDLFAARLADHPDASIVLLGTKTTIESAAHVARLRERSIGAGRMAAVPCHGLAGAIERDVDGPRTAEILAECAARAAAAAPPGAMLFLGLCCTHYGYIAGRLVDAVARLTPRCVRALDPNAQLTAGLLADPAFAGGVGPAVGCGAGSGAGREVRAAGGPGAVSVELVSKVTLSETARAGIARLVEPVSPPTAAALLSYALIPDLF
jgi:glutamate racemase